MILGNEGCIKFHHLYSQSMSPAELSDDGYALAVASWLCGHCKSPRPSMGPLNLSVLRSSITGKSPLTVINGCGVAIARRAFFVAVGWEEVVRDLEVGTVTTERDRALEEWVTFRGRRKLIVRGSRNVIHRLCPECGRHLYFSSIGGRYLFPAPPGETVFFESNLCGLLFPERVFEKIKAISLRGLTHEVLPVLHEPLDGLGRLD